MVKRFAFASDFQNSKWVTCRLINAKKILGIGDQGVGSVLISVAKLVLTTLCAGIHPARQLPVVLDCGTDVGY